MTVPIFNSGREPSWPIGDRAQFKLLVAEALNPLPGLVDRDTKIGSAELYKIRLAIIAESIENLGKSYNIEYTTNLEYLQLQLAAHSAKSAIPDLEKFPYFGEESHLNSINELGVQARRLSQRTSWLTEEQIMEVAELGMACSRFVATNAYRQLAFLTDNVFARSDMIVSPAQQRQNIFDSYAQWSDTLDQLMVSYATSRTFTPDNIKRLQDIDEVLANLEKLRVFQRDKTSEFLAPHFPGGKFEAEVFLLLKDMEKVNTRAVDNPGATMDLRAMHRLYTDHENNCTRTSVGTIHRLGGANVRAGAVAMDGSSKDTQVFSIDKFAKIYKSAPIGGWRSNDGQVNRFQTGQDVLRTLEMENERNGTTTALVRWLYTGRDFGHVTAATIIDGKAVIAESQDGSVLTIGESGNLARYEIDPDQPGSLKKTEPFELEIEDIAMVIVPESPTIEGRPCSHRAKCEQASAIMAQSWPDRFGPSEGQLLATR